MFLDRGFDLTTMDAIATAAGVSKRTLYARYADKTALFDAAVQQAIERWIVPPDQLRALATDDLEATLVAIARMRIAAVMSPEGLKIQRIIHAASFRFPNVLSAVFEQSNQPVVEFLADVLRHHNQAGTIRVERPYDAALIFMTMVIGGPTRSIATGVLPEMAIVEDLMIYSIKLFLDAIRTRP